ncbi:MULTISPECIES: hypothetical protein [Saccharibacillus]|uniref:hypothetical protein n=1 Tax=Saccharibacillus TaxID=456492 RepID=UPI0012396B8A|nr:hypothetical protein [Saccharibacillus sp. WB 17]MWJ31375.1 hypothetical protein [Saccharibacillus sp. WB 17]
MEEMLNQILQELQALRQDVQQLNQNQMLLDQNQKQMSIQIHSIYHNFTDKDSEVAALNKRIFRLESEFEKINRQ